MNIENPESVKDSAFTVTTRFISGDILAEKSPKKERPQKTPLLVRCEVYKQDLVVVRKAKNKPPKGGRRKSITKLSRKAWLNMVFNIANADAQWLSMLTLTIQSDVLVTDGKQLKLVLKRFIQDHLKANYGKDLKYAWFMEFQKSGQPHFHIFLNIVPPGPLRPRKSNKALHSVAIDQALGSVWTDYLKRFGRLKISQEISSNMAKASAGWEVLKSSEGASKYCAKECSKRIQKDVPEWFSRCGRFWGMSRGIKPVKKASDVYIPITELRGTTIETENASFWIPYKVQFGSNNSESIL